MALHTSYLAAFALLNWFGIALLVGVDAYDRDVRRYWQWGLLSLVLGVFGFAMYVLFVVSPSER